MLALSNVTLVCVDTQNHALALRALDHSCRAIRFARALLLTDALPQGLRAPAGMEIARIDPLHSRDDYSRFMLKRLLHHVDTPHVLVVQWDGHVIHPDGWQPAFLDCDYVGARWPWFDDGHDVGNGGFSLRSRKLLEALQDSRVELDDAEDLTIGRRFRTLLENDHGIRFATADLANRFSFEAAYPVGKPFGFHGLFNFCRTVPADELAALVPRFSDAIVRSQQFAQLARNCIALGLWQPALALARRLLAAEPGDGEMRALLAQGEAALARGAGVGRNDPCPCGSGKRYKQCHGAFGAGQPPTDANPGQSTPDATVQRGIEAHRRGELDAAASNYRRALAVDPQHPHALHYLGVIDYQRGQLRSALPLLERAAGAIPTEPEFHNNLGLAYAALDRHADAVAAHRRAIALQAGHAGAWNNLGLALQAGNDLRGAIDAFRQALSRASPFTEARWNLALALLADGQFREGWLAYEARLAIPAFASATTPATPRWQGGDPAGARILLVAEQGLGDAIQFIRFVPQLAARGATVSVHAPRGLVPLLRTVRGVSGSVAADEPPPPHDAWLPLLSLPGMLEVDATDLPGPIPYVRVDVERRASITRTLAGAGRGLRVGVAWAGNPRNVNDRRRSLALEAIAPWFHTDGVTWFSLQKEDSGGPGASALIELPERSTLEGTAALIDALDLVISVDTSIVHLAGALGRPVWVLLPYASDWRWRTGRSDSDWYPTARLFRQSRPGDWDGVVARVREAVERLAGR